jgi:hypothetical protein
LTISALFNELADIFAADVAIETHARAALKSAALKSAALQSAALQSAAHQQISGHVDRQPAPAGYPAPPPTPLVSIMAAPDALPVCQHLLQLPLDWSPPTTSSDPLFIKHSQPTVHIELVGPGGLVHADDIRIGLYGMTPNATYGIRTHPAEEIYVMLAGSVWWKRGDDDFSQHHPGSRSYHPSMMPHANRTEQRAFLSIYAWQGDISTDQYLYAGVPE